MGFYNHDTIAAVATPIGEGGIGIVRISGDDAIAIAEKVIRQKKSTISLRDRRSHGIFLATVVDPRDGSKVDEVLVSVMRTPHTYTREDVVEINCHGGVVALRKTLGLILSAGARAAEPGEFTKRAFLNGRIDLAQAEAVIDTIRSKTEAGLKAAINQLEGGLSKAVRDAADKLSSVLIQVEAAVDFSDEDIETLPFSALIQILKGAEEDLARLLKTSIKGRMIKEGVRATIIGRPNVGKSSLLNALLRKERAIVTSIPGTTRDTIEETVNINGIPLRLVDTAGIRESRDEIEKIGIELTRQAISTSEMVLVVVDGSDGLTGDDISLIGEVSGTTAILVVNKSDLPQNKTIKTTPGPDKFKASVNISALTGEGVDELEKKIEDILLAGDVEMTNMAIITNVRHEQLVEDALSSAREARQLIADEQPEEIIAMVIRDALDRLGEITGDRVDDDVLHRIFSQFCIGK